MRKWLIIAAAFVGIASWDLVTTALADDLFPPSWRGTNGSTFQEWTFSNPNNPTGPDLVNNPYGSPSALINFNAPFGTGWYNTATNVFGTKQGFWDIGNGSITHTLPNLPNNNVSYETIQIQITYWRDISQAPSYGYSSSAFATQIGSTTTTLVQDPAGPGAWYSDLTLWHVTPNPNMDTITILGDLNFGSVIDQIVIDTLAVPEPSTASLMALALGGAVLWSLRRRKN